MSTDRCPAVFHHRCAKLAGHGGAHESGDSAELLAAVEDAEAERDGYRGAVEALHAIAGMTHQDIDRPASWWGLISEIHLKARRGLGTRGGR